MSGDAYAHGRSAPCQPPCSPLRELCLVFVTRSHDDGAQVLLGEKLRGFGSGRVVGPGGKVDAGETPREAAARELFEETGLRTQPGVLVERGIVTFAFPHGDGPNLRTHVFTLDADTQPPRGELTPSDELAAAWVTTTAIPYDRMWPDARLWLSRALAGTLQEAAFSYAADGVTIESFTLEPASDDT